MTAAYLSIQYGGEFMHADLNGNISRPQRNHTASGQWRLTGAVRFNNFGNVVERWTLADIIAGKVKSWRHKNGKQRVFACDIDHGTARTWMSPEHSIWPVA